nr:MAG TPA: FeoB-associated Cys-rich membrane protein [Caudoviricetes sp.]
MNAFLFALPPLIITVILLAAVVWSLIHDHRKGVSK